MSREDTAEETKGEAFISGLSVLAELVYILSP